jgi:hypothetical protein
VIQRRDSGRALLQRGRRGGGQLGSAGRDPRWDRDRDLGQDPVLVRRAPTPEVPTVGVRPPGPDLAGVRGPGSAVRRGRLGCTGRSEAGSVAWAIHKRHFSP